MSLILAFTTFAASAANAWYVDGEKSTNGAGDSWATAFNSLQAALNNQELLADDVIWVKGKSTGITYKPGTTRTSTFTLKSGVKIYGGFAGTESPTQFALRDPVANLTILSGEIGNLNTTLDNCHHVVSAIGALQFPGTILDGFTITGGSTFDRSENPPDDFSGGGIRSAAAESNLRCSVVSPDESDAATPSRAEAERNDPFAALLRALQAVLTEVETR